MKPVSARDVALIGYRGLEENKSVIIPGFINKLTIFFVRFIPRNMLANITRKIQEKKN
jgi:short-subunit dehydrogenase